MKLEFSQPNDKQEIFINDVSHKHLGYGGARGGGKSWAVRIKATILALFFAGIKILIVRRTYPELTTNHIHPLKELYRALGLMPGTVKYNNTEKMFTFRNGSIIKFMYCANDEDLHNFQGTEWDVIFLDEATQLSEKQCRDIAVCCRGVNSFPKQINYTCNPGGQSHSYFKRIFVDKRFEDKEKPENFAFVQALVYDNVALMEAQPDYVEFLETLPPKLRDMWLYGRWDIYEGMFFEDFRTTPDPQMCLEKGISIEQAEIEGRYTHVIDPLPTDVVRQMKLYRSYDFGSNKPFSCAWWGVNKDGIIFRILEFYGCTETPNEGLNWTPDEQFSKIAETEREHPYLKGMKISGVADPSIWDASRGISIAETARKYGIYFEPGDNKRIPGWMQCHYRLSFDDNGYPLMYVFRNCEAFIRTIPTLMYSKHKPEDLDTELEDHVADEWRYFCMSRPIAPRKKSKAKKPVYDPLDLQTDKYKKIKDWSRF